MTITRVLVSPKDDITGYICLPVKLWICGKCMKGLLGPSVGKGDKCPKCGAVVVNVEIG